MGYKQLSFDDIFDMKELEKTHTQVIEANIKDLKNELKVNSNIKKDVRNNKNKLRDYDRFKKEYYYAQAKLKAKEEREKIKALIREVLIEEIGKMPRSSLIFNDKFFLALEKAEFERDCIGCKYSQINHGIRRI